MTSTSSQTLLEAVQYFADPDAAFEIIESLGVMPSVIRFVFVGP